MTIKDLTSLEKQNNVQIMNKTTSTNNNENRKDNQKSNGINVNSNQD